MNLNTSLRYNQWMKFVVGKSTNLVPQIVCLSQVSLLPSVFLASMISNPVYFTFLNLGVGAASICIESYANCVLDI